ncbi:MAG TPA: pyridoxal phosphate-dependent aminotransferase family protein [Rhizomicrobium sp.]|nr:pyridoxal phosphate-dependent aminotransferase family protein [Rhizomicrobium sp.]
MSGTRSLDEYIWRRMRIAGGTLLRHGSIEENVAALKEVYFQPLDSLQAAVRARAGRFVSFANYDYLGLGEDSRVRQAAADAALSLGVGAEASRLVGGSRTVHDLLEREIADFLGVEDSVTLVSGWMTNASLLGYLLTRSDLIVIDELAHNSIVVGADVSHAKVLSFDHGNLDTLDALLAEHRPRAKRALIVVEGLYSMDGDMPDLRRVLDLKYRHDAWLMLDEAHSIGVLGPTGRGITEHFGIDPGEIDFIIGTLSKTFAASGGFIAGRKSVIEWLRFTLPACMFSVGLSPVIAAAVREGLSVMRHEPWRTARVQENSRFFLDEARARDLNVGDAVGAGVVSIQFPSYDMCMQAAEKLLQAGYYAPPIPIMAVPKNKPRIRFFISATHTREDIADVLDVLAAAMPAGRRRAEAETAAELRLGS